MASTVVASERYAQEPGLGPEYRVEKIINGPG